MRIIVIITRYGLDNLQGGEPWQARRQSGSGHGRHLGHRARDRAAPASEGAYVFITGRRKAELGAALEKIGGNVTGVQGDVSKLEDLDRLYAIVKKEKGGSTSSRHAGVGEFSALGTITEEHFDKTFDTNVKACCSRCRRRCRSFARAFGHPERLDHGLDRPAALSVYGAARRRCARLRGPGPRDSRARTSASTSSARAWCPPRVTRPPWDERAAGGAVRGAGRARHPLAGWARRRGGKVVSFLASDESSYVRGSSCSWTGAWLRSERGVGRGEAEGRIIALHGDAAFERSTGAWPVRSWIPMAG